MQKHIINVSKTTKIIICFFSFFLFSIVLFGIVIADHTKHEKLKSINGRAGMHYSYFSKNKNDLFLKLNIPEKGEYYITGECFESSYYLAYKNELNDKTILLTGKANTQPNGYWGMKIVDNNITDIWFCENKLSVRDLKEYSSKDQIKKIKLFNSNCDKNIIGHHEKR